MSWQAARAVLDIDALNPTAKFVLIVLCLRAGADGRTWPSVATICADTGYADSAVRRALIHLQKSGHIGLIHRSGRSSLVSVDPVLSERGTAFPSTGTAFPRTKKRVPSDTQKYKEVKQEVAEPASPALRSGSASNGNGCAPHELLHDYEWVELDDGTVERRWLHGQSS
jgi:hypothetical protein